LVAKDGRSAIQITAIGTSAAAAPSLMLTATAVVSPTPEVQPIFEYSEEGRKNNVYGVGAIGIAAIFLGVLFTVITRKKPV
jgi:hypothetical protein